MATITKIKFGESVHALGEGTQTIDITDLDVLETVGLLDNCLLKDNEHLYHLTCKNASEYYFENFDEHIYRYICVTSTGEIDRWDNVPLATSAELASAINNKVQCVINDDGSIDLFIN